MNDLFVVDAVRACLGEVYLVGGVVRDSLMGVSNTADFDFTTPLRPSIVKKRLLKNGYPVIDYSAKFGTIATSIGNNKVEITTFRNEAYSNQTRSPEVSFEGVTLEDDLARRDFTMNAIAHDGEKYIDPFDGQSDIIHKKIRTVGDARKRFTEDPLRILRAIRFVSQYGFTVAPDTYDAFIECAPRLQNISGERISDELNKILIGPYWMQAVSLAIESDILPAIFGVESVVVEPYKDSFLENISTTYVQRTEASETKHAWQRILIALHHALQEKLALKDAQSLYSSILVSIHRRLRWPNNFANDIRYLAAHELQKNSIEHLRKELENITDDDSSQSYFVQEKLYKLELREAFDARNFSKVEEIATNLLVVQEKTMNLNLQSSSDKDQTMKLAAKYILLTLSYLCAIEYTKLPYATTKKELVDIIQKVATNKQIAAKVRGIGLSYQDLVKCAEVGLMNISNLMPGRFHDFHAAEIADFNQLIVRDVQRYGYIRKLYLRWLRELKQPPYDESVKGKRARINRRLAAIELKLNDGEPNEAHYVDLMDYYKWSIMSTDDIVRAWELYDKLNQTADKMLDLPTSNRFAKEPYIYNAQSLVHILSLETVLEEKISIVRAIIADYLMSGPMFARNAPRYKVLLQWLILAEKIANTEGVSYKQLAAYIRSLDAYDYEDVDETYVAKNLPEINQIRSDLKDGYILFSQLAGVQTVEKKYRDMNTDAVMRLFHAGIVDDEGVISLYSKIIQIKVAGLKTIEPVTITDGVLSVQNPIIEDINQMRRDIIQMESSMIEFKESWKYDVKERQIDKSGEVRLSAQKAVAGMLNAQGGRLYLGITDKGEISGLEAADFRQYKKLQKSEMRDRLEREMRDVLSKSLGMGATSLYEVSYIEPEEGKTVALLKVQASKNPVYFNEKHFFVRQGGSTRELHGKDLVEYVHSRQ